MNQVQEPSLPAVSKDPEQQRFLDGVRAFVREMLRKGAFLERAEVTRVIRSRLVGEVIALKWGTLNRVEIGNTEAKCTLPRIEAAWIGKPLYFAKMNGTGTTTATLSPSGRSVGNFSLPTINNASSFAVDKAGLYVLITDGQNWFCTGEP